MKKKFSPGQTGRVRSSRSLQRRTATVWRGCPGSGAVQIQGLPRPRAYLTYSQAIIPKHCAREIRRGGAPLPAPFPRPPHLHTAKSIPRHVDVIRSFHSPAPEECFRGRGDQGAGTVDRRLPRGTGSSRRHALPPFPNWTSSSAVPSRFTPCR